MCVFASLGMGAAGVLYTSPPPTCIALDESPGNPLPWVGIKTNPAKKGATELLVNRFVPQRRTAH